MGKFKIGLPAKICLVICGVVLMAFAVALIASGSSQDFANWWWLHVTRPVDSAMYLLFQRIPVKYYAFLIILAIIALLCVLIPKIGRGFAVSMVGVIAVMALVPLLNYCQDTTIDKIDRLYFSGREEKEYSADELYDLALFFRKKTKNLAKKAMKLERNYELQDLTDLAAKNLGRLSEEFGFLAGSFVDEIEFGDFDYTGQTFPYRVTVAKDYGDGELLNTVTHELCHTKGIAREDEATFCAIMAGIQSGDEFSQYVGYSEALRMSAIALTMMGYNTNKIQDLFGAFQGECRANSAHCSEIYLNVNDLRSYEIDDMVDAAGKAEQLAPFSRGGDLNMLLFDGENYDKEYYYSRSARLLMEYFDLKGRTEFE